MAAGGFEAPQATGVKNDGVSAELPGYVAAEEHNRALNKIAKLSQDLEHRITEAEYASKACRDLASWTYNERNRLHQEMGLTRAETARKVEEAVNKEHRRITTKVAKVLVAEINKAKTEVRLAPMSTEDMRIVLDKIMNVYKDTTDSEDTEAGHRLDQDNAMAVMDDLIHQHFADFAPSVSDQVDELIAQEVGNLMVEE
ncbi:hypothetical protein T440DRAFT_516217 [Plenodomus tracheiphilus IPT5]|uniref:Uncharacterized protein n=1 Tax=Plenodomus tracheiphilus IPT5 TaxID=1408161 RepID=A0A6A7BFE8_9PLEO|nr:hypothetical protein T440DRAFT_516217 [Plenodomus tracheiphilus IPT5]